MISANATYMLNVHAQCMSLNKLNSCAKLEVGFLIRAKMSRQGTSPKTTNNRIPGIKKFLNGDLSKIDRGNPPNNLPEGEIINAPPPTIALKPRKANKKKNNLCCSFLHSYQFKIL